MKRRVVVTGMGAVTPIGIGAGDFWKAAVAGKSGLARITRFNADDFPVKIAGEVKGFNPEAFMERREVGRMDLFIQYAVASADMAVKDSGLKAGDSNADRIATIIGVGLGGLPVMEQNYKALTERGPRRISPFFIPAVIANLAPGEVSIRHGFRGPNFSTVSACASGTHAIGEAARMIRDGLVDAAVAGGSEAAITPLCIGGFAAMRALSTRNDDPQAASRPFDKDRDGFVCAEGCGIMVIEELEQAMRRGARILAEVAGYGANADAHHVTAPSPGGSGAAKCMALALADAGMAPGEIDYINAHGTSTPLNDALETAAIKTVFGDHARRLAVSSTKSMIGHLLGAAGAVEAIAAIKTIVEGVIHPTINYTTPDPECDLDYVPNQAREAKVRAALSNSFGFGGTNAVLAFRRFDG